MPEKVIEYSVVVPVYNEEESLKPLLSEILQAMTSLGCAYEIIFVNDGSCDGSSAVLREFELEVPELVRVISLLERGGQTHALRKGLEASRGRVVITLDADLQNDPADISKLLAKMAQGYDCVCGWRKDREDTPLKAGLSKLGNILQRLLTGMKIHDVSCTLRAYRRECLDKIILDWEGRHRFIPLSLSLQGCRVDEIVSHHRGRKFGRSKYGHRRIFRVVRDFFKVLDDRRLRRRI